MAVAVTALRVEGARDVEEAAGAVSDLVRKVLGDDGPSRVQVLAVDERNGGFEVRIAGYIMDLADLDRAVRIKVLAA